MESISDNCTEEKNGHAGSLAVDFEAGGHSLLLSLRTGATAGTTGSQLANELPVVVLAEGDSRKTAATVAYEESWLEIGARRITEEAFKNRGKQLK